MITTRFSHIRKFAPRLGMRSVRSWQKDKVLDRYEDLVSLVKRKKLLLRAVMTTRHSISFRLPSFISREREIVHSPSFTLSELAGHGSFVFLALSYLESDFFSLRLYAFSGITLSILFQYYRQIPLWIPIRWNTLFLLINGVMMALLLKKQNDANNLSEEETYMYERCFKQRGMSRVDFLSLISMAKRLEASQGTKLVEQDKKNTRVYLVKDGTLSVYKGHEKVGSIKANQFVGAMSYLRWQTKRNEQALQESQAIATALNNANQPAEEAKPVVDVKASEDEIAADVAADLFRKWFEWDSKPADANVQTEQTAQQSGTNATLTEQNQETTTAVAPSAETVLPASQSTAVAAAQAAPAQSQEEGHLGQADVICDDDCVVYYWKFKDLYELMLHHPMLGLVFERSISEDLNRKMASTWEVELRHRYRAMLSQAVTRYQLHHRNNNHHHNNVVVGEEEAVKQNEDGLHLIVDHKDRNNLRDFRTENSISSADHHRLLKEVLTEYEAMAQEEKEEREREDAVTRQYRTLLSNELKRPRGVSDAAKKHLRDFRLTHDISGETHVRLLEDSGWTLDEYEIGRRLTSKDRSHFESRRAQPMATPTSPKSSIDSFLAAKYGRSSLREAEEENEATKAKSTAPTVRPSSSSTSKTTKQQPSTDIISSVIQQDLLAAVQAVTHGDEALLGQVDEVQLHYVLDTDASHAPVVSTVTVPVEHDVQRDGTKHSRVDFDNVKRDGERLPMGNGEIEGSASSSATNERTWYAWGSSWLTGWWWTTPPPPITSTPDEDTGAKSS